MLTASIGLAPKVIEQPQMLKISTLRMKKEGNVSNIATLP